MHCTDEGSYNLVPRSVHLLFYRHRANERSYNLQRGRRRNLQGPTDTASKTRSSTSLLTPATKSQVFQQTLSSPHHLNMTRSLFPPADLTPPTEEHELTIPSQAHLTRGSLPYTEDEYIPELAIRGPSLAITDSERRRHRLLWRVDGCCIFLAVFFVSWGMLWDFIYSCMCAAGKNTWLPYCAGNGFTRFWRPFFAISAVSF